MTQKGIQSLLQSLKRVPCFVTQVKTSQIDGYFSIQAGFEDVNEKHVNNPQFGHFKKANISPKKYLAEFKPVKNFEYKKGQMFSVSIFKKVSSLISEA